MEIGSYEVDIEGLGCKIVFSALHLADAMQRARVLAIDRTGSVRRGWRLYNHGELQAEWDGWRIAHPWDA